MSSVSDSTSSFCDFLTESGLNRYYKNETSLNLRLYHDLNIYGDVAESYIELLHDGYGVNVSRFYFEDYFPDEFVGNSARTRILLWLFPFLRKRNEDEKEFKVFTFRKLKESIDSGHLL